MKPRTITKKLTVGSLFLGVALVGSVAFAAWTATGNGSGYAEATTGLNVSTVSATTSAQLYPGKTGDVFIKIANPNPYPVTVTALAANGAITSDKGAACNLSTGVTYTAPPSLSLVVPALSAGTQFTLSNAVTMTTASDNTCQGAIFTIPVTVTAAS